MPDGTGGAGSSGAGAGGAGGAGAGAGGAAGGGAGGGPLGGLSGLLGSQTLQVVAAGLLVGVVASSGLVATNVVHFGPGPGPTSPAGPQLELLACPGSGQVVGDVVAGTQMLATGRNSDGTWLQVYFPGPAISRAWAPAAQLHAGSSTSSLPVEACTAPPTASPSAAIVVTASPTASPTTSPTASPSPSPSPTAKPTAKPTPRPTPKPTPKPTPTPTPTDVPPTGAISIFGKTFPAAGDAACTKALVDVRASDPDGTVVRVDMYYQPYPGSPPTVGLQHVVMTYQQANGIWQGYMGNTVVGTTWPLPALSGYSTSPYVVITDNGGKTTKVTTSVTVLEQTC